MKVFLIWLRDSVLALIKYFFSTVCSWIFSLLGSFFSLIGVKGVFDNIQLVWDSTSSGGFTSLVAKFFPVDDFLVLFGLFFTIEIFGFVYRVIIKVLRG